MLQAHPGGEGKAAGPASHQALAAQLQPPWGISSSSPGLEPEAHPTPGPSTGSWLRRRGLGPCRRAGQARDCLTCTRAGLPWPKGHCFGSPGEGGTGGRTSERMLWGMAGGR